MKPCSGALYVVLLLTSFVQAQSAVSALSELPTCALTCIVQGIPDTNCTLTDIACLCTSTALWHKIGACTLEACTTREALTAQNISKSACDVPARDRTEGVKVTGPTLLAVSTVFIVARVLVRCQKQFALWGWDDTAIAVAWLISVPAAAFHDRLAQNGLGKDIWEVTFQQIDNMLFYFYLGEPFYLFSTMLTKVSILAFYLRVFPDRIFRRMVFILMGLLCAFAVAFLFALTFQCSPISYAWTHWDNQMHGHCIDINGGTWAHAAINIAFDLTVLLLPVPQLKKLQITSWRTKLQIAFMFSCGIFVTLVSVLRLRPLVLFANTTNPTWDYYLAGIWSAAELYVGIICACLPAARVCVLRTIPEWLGVAARGSSAEPVPYQPRVAPPQDFPWPKSQNGTTVSTGEVSADFYQLPSRDGSPIK